MYSLYQTVLADRCRSLFSVLCIIATVLGPDTSFARQLSPNEYCMRMPTGVVQTSCLGYYVNASSATQQFCKAMQWRWADMASYWCSGINEACLAAELRLGRGKAVVHVCTPLPDGSPCGGQLVAGLQPQCTRGICQGRKGQKAVPPALPKVPIPSTARLAGYAQIQTLKSQRTTPVTGLDATAFTPQPVESITVDIDTVRLGVAIPRGFLGVSIEWPGIEHYGSNVGAWGRVLKVLGPGPIIRVGGSSQDKLTEVPGVKSWQAMAALHREVGMRFIIGLPLMGDNALLLKDMMAVARQHLPEQAIIGFELGNEPTYWQVCPDIYTGAGGWDEAGVFQPGWVPYAAYFDRMARNITGCASSSGRRGEKVIIGPGWDNMNTLPAIRSSEVMQDGSCYLKDMSVHYYPYYSKNTFDATSLLSEDLAREAARNATLHVQTAAAQGLKVRITEANSLSGAGEEGTSDAYAAALWTADMAFELAATGVQSLHFHWGHGGLPGNTTEDGVPVYAGIRTIHFINGTTAPSPRAPWFGYLLFQAAASPTAAAAAGLGSTVAGSVQPGRFATIASAAATPGCSKGQIKLWPVLHESSKPGWKELRVVLLNKSGKEDCTVVLQVNDAFGQAALTRVMPAVSSGPGGMMSKVIRFGGAMFTDLSGVMSSRSVAETVAASLFTVRSGKFNRPGTRYSIHMPRATAAVLVAQDRA